jgi:hypothetical protein
VVRDWKYSKNCFQANKLAYLTLLPKKTHGLEGDKTEEKDGKKKTKCLKGRGSNGSRFIDLGNMVKNGSSNADWKIRGVKYKQIFTPAITTTTPHFNATGLVTCNKWHCQGFCYEKCDRKASHKNFELASHKAASIDKWVKDLLAKNP